MACHVLEDHMEVTAVPEFRAQESKVQDRWPQDVQNRCIKVKQRLDIKQFHGPATLTENLSATLEPLVAESLSLMGIL